MTHTHTVTEGKYIYTVKLVEVANFTPSDMYDVVIEDDRGFYRQVRVDAWSVKGAIKAAKIEAGIK